MCKLKIQKFGNFNNILRNLKIIYKFKHKNDDLSFGLFCLFMTHIATGFFSAKGIH